MILSETETVELTTEIIKDTALFKNMNNVMPATMTWIDVYQSLLHYKCTWKSTVQLCSPNILFNIREQVKARGVSRIFERGGPISLGSLKKGHQILKGGSNGLIGGVQYNSLPRTTNLAYLDAKE